MKAIKIDSLQQHSQQNAADVVARLDDYFDDVFVEIVAKDDEEDVDGEHATNSVDSERLEAMAKLKHLDDYRTD